MTVVPSVDSTRRCPAPLAAHEASLYDIDLKYGDIMTLDALEGLVGAHAR